ncbi:MAG: ubiquinol-cytochrome c reductase iron-sulfur subunit [Planctomycetaceae bacterium]|nr:ubiquinol-cytochrome c reductase iron-sulfur subunit [Planctomycetaceae bacterium]
MLTSGYMCLYFGLYSQPIKLGEVKGTQVVDDQSLYEPRRSFLQRWPTALMAFGLTAGYGMFAALIGRFLFPSHRRLSGPQYVSDLRSFRVGASMTYVSPAGEKVVLTRVSETGSSEDFIALSSVCPHLGCQVHWEGQNDRFFCPCHNGAFDSEGRPIAGPPKDANQSLPRYELHVENGLLFIDAATEALVDASLTSSHTT